MITREDFTTFNNSSQAVAVTCQSDSDYGLSDCDIVWSCKGGTYCFHIQGLWIMKQDAPPKRFHSLTRLYGVATKKTTIWIHIAMST
jgi:hypothetical protein